MINRVAVAAILGIVVPLAAQARPTSAMTTDLSDWIPLGTEDREAIGRVVFAEAANQGEEGLAAVTHIVLNRMASGQYGRGAQAVVDAPGQFEPVMRAGGSWRLLPPLTAEQRLVFGTILDLILQGRLPDLTNGSTHFQNARIVADRVATNQVPPALLNFGGQTPAAVVRDHSFYRSGSRLVHASTTISLSAGEVPSGPVASATLGPAGSESILIRMPGSSDGGSHIRIIRGGSSGRPAATRPEASPKAAATASR